MLRVGVLLFLIGLAACLPPVTRTKEEVDSYREALEKSREDDGLELDSRVQENPEANIWENSGKFQGDIILTDDQIDGLVAGYENPEDDGRAAYIVAGRRWPGNVLIYEFGANEFNAAQQRAILDAMGWVERFSCVRFRRRTNERNFVRMTGRATGCYAHVGFHSTMPVHTLNLARANPGQGCFHNIVIIHELLHNLGFHHMHSAYERYNFVRINWNNIQNNMAFAFYRYGRNQVSLLNLPYEYTSSMHYSTHAFSRNRQPTIVATRSFNGVMGHMRYVTHYDWVRLRRHYNCPGGWSAEVIEEVKKDVERTMPLMLAQLPPPQDIPSYNQDIVNEEEVINNDDTANEDIVY